MKIAESKLVKLLRDEINEHEKTRGRRYVVEVDRAALEGVLKEFESMDHFIKAGNEYNKEHRVRHAIRSFIKDQRVLVKADIYKSVLNALLEELGNAN